jgi:hypothetical protein
MTDQKYYINDGEVHYRVHGYQNLLLVLKVLKYTYEEDFYVNVRIRSKTEETFHEVSSEMDTEVEDCDLFEYSFKK